MNSMTANILVTCTKRKRMNAQPRLRLGTVARGSPNEVASRWIERLERSSSQRFQASSLYAGDHWQISSALPFSASRAGLKAELWVLSAGYGLIRGTATVVPYSATFSVGHPDEVVARFHDSKHAGLVRQWWDALSKWAGPEKNAPRTVATLAAAAPRSPIIVVASPKYVSATLDDLLAARDALADPCSLIVVSAGCRGKGPLSANMIDCSARLQATLGGALMSLNARVARNLIENAPPGSWTVNGFQELLQKIPAVESDCDRPSRVAVTDDDVRQYVESALHKAPASRHTTLLRLFREAGFACEQKRFGRLFMEVEQSHGRTH